MFLIIDNATIALALTTMMTLLFLFLKIDGHAVKANMLTIFVNLFKFLLAK